MSAGDVTPGKRCANSALGEPGPGWDEWKVAGPGAYMLVDVGERIGAPGNRIDLWIRDPRGHEGRCQAGIHTMTVNEDGTITVQPSIAPIDTDPGGWHGFLIDGTWREV